MNLKKDLLTSFRSETIIVQLPVDIKGFLYKFLIQIHTTPVYGAIEYEM